MGRVCVALSLLILSACVEIPDLGEVGTADLSNVPYPRLIPLDQFSPDAAARTPGPGTAIDPSAALELRVARLRARAAALRALP